MLYKFYNEDTGEVEELYINGYGCMEIIEVSVRDEKLNDVTERIPANVIDDMRAKLYEASGKDLIESDYD